VAENLKATVAKVDELKKVRRGGISLAEMALRFILNNKDVSTIIPGMRKIANVEVNVAASDRGGLPGPVHKELQKHRWDRTPTKWSQ
jgi:aryl-alcohol dehydrogenase-like predicted oxidoreductase